MKKINIKFAISLTLLINAVIFVFFFEDSIYGIENYIFPLFFIYFIADSATILIPKLNNMIYSSKMDKKNILWYQILIKTCLKNRKREIIELLL